jgi:hypothetical protein
MPSVDESAAEQRKPLGAALAAGLENVSYNQTVTFVRYVRLVLPIDGFVFWVKADLVSDGALLDGSPLNNVAPDQGGSALTAARTIVAKGSLHYSTEARQNESEGSSVNRIVFTSEVEIADLNAVGPNELFIAEVDGVRFAFSSQDSRYSQAGLWHYGGTAVYADMETQLVDALDGFDATAAVVSNSLPIWLSMNGLPVVDWRPIRNPVTLYPSFLVPGSLVPPFAAVHIDPNGAQGIASAATLGRTLSHSQLVSDRVRVTTYGLRNARAQDFVDFVAQFSLDTDLIGITNMPVVRDEKRTQVELGAIGQKKVIDFEVTYYQTAARDVARNLITSAIPAFIFHD